MRVLFFVNLNKKNAQQCTLRAIQILTEAGADCSVVPPAACGLLQKMRVAKEEEAVSFDVLAAVGGDGTIMETAKTAVRAGKPLLVINVGRMGFLSGVKGNEPEKLTRLFRGQMIEHQRMLLQIDFEGKNLIAVNDIVVSKPVLSNLIDLSVACNHRPVISYRADAVLFSTPTGSTASALSNGGPIADPDLAFLSMSPICPHSLISRPYLFSDSSILKATLGKSSKAHLIVDGQPVALLENGARFTIKRSASELRLLTLEDHAFFEAVREKFLPGMEEEQPQ